METAGEVTRISDRHNLTKVSKDLNSFLEKSDAADDRAKVAKLYDEWTSYDEDVKAVEFKGPSATGALVSKYVTDKSASILDCGAGTGLAGQVVYSNGFTNLTAIDISQKFLDIAKTKNIYSRLIWTEVGKKQMPFEDNEFDALMCSGCFLPGHMNQSVFPDWIRVVKPGGYIINVMRSSFLDDPEFKEGFPKAVQELEASKKWTKVAEVPVPEYFDLHMGVGFVFQVL